MKTHKEHGYGSYEKIKRAIVIFIILFALYLSVMNSAAGKSILYEVKNMIPGDTIIIDPGHGGFDGGAESASGICEKDINLNIANEIRLLAHKEGYNVIMTREDDEALGHTESNTIRSRKTADIRERKRIIDECRPLLTVSIHLNSFKEDPDVHGAQVFYPAGDNEVSDKSRLLAESVRRELIKGLDDGTQRAVLPKKGVRIMEDALTPIIIVECGFLSNREEAEKLEKAGYQRKLAGCIYKGIKKYVKLK